MYQRPASPQSIGGVLDDGFRLYRASLGKIWGLAFLASLVSQLPSAFMPPAAEMAAAGEAIMPTVLILVAVSLVAGMFFLGAIIARIDAVADQQPMTLGGAFGVGFKKMLPLLGAAVLYGLAMFVGLILLVVPGIILGLSLAFCVYAVVLDDVGPVTALTASHRLVWGNWWRTLVIISVGMVVLMAAYLLIGIVVGIVVAAGGSTEPGVLLRVVELVLVPLLGAVLTPLVYALYLATYYDLKLRRSGADLEQRLTATAAA